MASRDDAPKLTRVCVFCGSNPGSNGSYLTAATTLGDLIARSGLELVYGGGATGIMGAIADSALNSGGRVIGVLPRSMEIPGVVHENLSELHVVDTMHLRKAKMAELADAFIALPGGMGTLEELFEALTWSQLGYQPKPIGILNVDGYYNPLLELIEHMIDQGFVKAMHRGIFAASAQPDELLALLAQFRHPAGSKWTELS